VSGLLAIAEIFPLLRACSDARNSGRGSSAGVKLKTDIFVQKSKAQDAEDGIVYDRSEGVLHYDMDDTGSQVQIKIATFTTKPKLYYHDFYVI
jgi:hypothetical protein